MTEPDRDAAPVSEPSAGTAPAAPTAPRPVEPEYLMALEPPDPTEPALTTASAAPPTETPPVVAPPAAAPPAAAAARRGGRVALVTVSVVAGLAVVLSGALGYLWWDAERQLEDARASYTAELAEITETVLDHERERKRLDSELQSTTDELYAVRQELEGAENMVEVLRGEQGVIRRCLTLSAELVDALFAGDQAAFDALVDEVDEVCDEADQVLGS